jgi:hypothetical protein
VKSKDFLWFIGGIVVVQNVNKKHSCTNKLLFLEQRNITAAELQAGRLREFS